MFPSSQSKWDRGHRLTISPQQTTLYDEIKYVGSPADFAWVLPIHGEVTVGLSSDSVFSALEKATQTTIVSPILPPCPVSSCPCAFRLPDGSAVGIDAAIDAAPPVTVLSQQTIGPYAAVQLKSTDSNALNAWLSANGYDIPADIQPIVAAYVGEGFDFLALKLAPGQGVQAMRPVRVTTPGAGLSLPLRMVAAGTGALVGITLWIVADGSYEPQNFPFFTISASALTWDWSINRSNYTTVQTQKESSYKNTAWQIESSLAISAYTIENAVMQATSDYVPLPTEDGGTMAVDDGGSGQTPAQARDEDLVVQAATDQTVIPNLYQVTKSVNAPTCPIPPPCNCGSTGSRGSSGSSGSSGSTASSGSNGSGISAGEVGDGGVVASEFPPEHHAGCAASTSEPGHDGLVFIAAGFVGTALVRTRRKRPRSVQDSRSVNP